MGGSERKIVKEISNVGIRKEGVIGMTVKVGKRRGSKVGSTVVGEDTAQRGLKFG